MKQASDGVNWQWAKELDYTILTTDSDFVEMSRQLGWPPKVIHLVECDFPLRVIEELLRQNAVRISEFDGDRRSGVLSIRFSEVGLR